MSRQLQSSALTAAAGAAAMLSGCSAAESSSTDRFRATGELVALSGGGAGAANACFTCHGIDGKGDGAGTPRLAGLNFGYLERQLEAFGDGRRHHPMMHWIATNLSPQERKMVSAYYAAMPWSPDPSPAARPLPLYFTGDPDRGLPACAACHGALGQGLGPAYPPLGGQPEAYLRHQFEQWRKARRRNDPGAVMLRISQLLTPRESAALAAFSATLPGGPPGRESRAAFPEARLGDPRNDASGPPLHEPESARAGR